MTVFASVLPVSLTRLFLAGKGVWAGAGHEDAAVQHLHANPRRDQATVAREAAFNEAMDCIWVAERPNPKEYSSLPALVRERKYRQAVKRYQQVLALHVETCVHTIQEETQLEAAIARFQRFAVNCTSHGEDKAWCTGIKKRLAEKLLTRIQAASYQSDEQRLEFAQRVQAALPR